jgi:hypothetical protein
MDDRNSTSGRGRNVSLGHHIQPVSGTFLSKRDHVTFIGGKRIKYPKPKGGHLPPYNSEKKICGALSSLPSTYSWRGS